MTSAATARFVLSATGASRKRRGSGRTRKRYGLRTPGIYQGIVAWRSREHWLSELYSDLASADVDVMRRDDAVIGKRGKCVSAEACYAVGRAIANAADSGTGRNALPGNGALTADVDQLDVLDPAYGAKLARVTGYGKTTVRKAVMVLIHRGWLVQLRSGKNWLRRDERMELYKSGSTARQRRNVWACTYPAHCRPSPAPSGSESRALIHRPDIAVDNSSPANTEPVYGCALPTTQSVSGSVSVPKKNCLNGTTSRNAPPGRPPEKHPATQKRTYRADRRTVRVAADLRHRIPWLRRTDTWRIMRSVHRFAVAGWTATDLQDALDQVLTSRGWTVPEIGSARPLEHPYAYLAMLLRAIEPTDLAAERAYQEDLDQRMRRYETLLISGPPCPHGQPGGDVPSPTRHVLACPFCRRAAASA